MSPEESVLVAAHSQKLKSNSKEGRYAQNEWHAILCVREWSGEGGCVYWKK